MVAEDTDLDKFMLQNQWLSQKSVLYQAFRYKANYDYRYFEVNKKLNHIYLTNNDGEQTTRHEQTSTKLQNANSSLHGLVLL